MFLLQKIVVACFLLYGYNLIAAPLNLIVPINFITDFFVSLLGIPALFSFLIIYLIIF